VTFRPGDRVSWDDIDIQPMKEGKVYEVEEVDSFIGFTIIRVKGIRGFWHPLRFKLVKRGEEHGKE